MQDSPLTILPTAVATYRHGHQWARDASLSAFPIAGLTLAFMIECHLTTQLRETACPPHVSEAMFHQRALCPVSDALLFARRSPFLKNS